MLTAYLTIGTWTVEGALPPFVRPASAQRQPRSGRPPATRERSYAVCETATQFGVGFGVD
jgi:hypothetical protein